MRVLNIRWIGVPTPDLDAMRWLLESVLGLRVAFAEPTTVELVTEEDDRIQLFAPGNPYFERFRGPVPLFEVEDVGAARAELEAAGVELVGDLEHDFRWEWLTLRAPDGNLYQLASRRPG